MEFEFSIEKLFNLKNDIMILNSDANSYFNKTDLTKLNLIIDTMGNASSKVNFTSKFL